MWLHCPKFSQCSNLELHLEGSNFSCWRNNIYTKLLYNLFIVLCQKGLGNSYINNLFLLCIGLLVYFAYENNFKEGIMHTLNLHVIVINNINCFMVLTT